MIGTLANAGAIIIGSIIGILIRSRLPEKVNNIVFQAIGLFTLVIGISMSLKSDNLIVVLISIVAGAIIGQIIDIDKYIHRFARYMQFKYSKGTSKDNPEDAEDRFSEGLVTSSVLFCIGSMSILGAIEEGMGQTPNLLFTKSVIDGISSIALASSFGIAIAFSSVPLLIYQGGLTFLATFVMRYMSDAMTDNLTATGGILLIGLAINILKIKEISISNMLPALILVVILSYFFN